MKTDMLNDHPMVFAQALAKMLKADRIATGQIKEHIPNEELIEILGIKPLADFESVGDMIRHCEFEDYEVREYLKGAADNYWSDFADEASDGEVLEYVRRRFSKSEILDAVA